MAQEKVFPKGISVFPPRNGAPEFVKGSVVVTIDDLVQFAKDNEQYLSEYNGKKQLRLDLLDGTKNGLYFQVNTFKPQQPATDGKSHAATPMVDDLDSQLPF